MTSWHAPRNWQQHRQPLMCLGVSPCSVGPAVVQTCGPSWVRALASLIASRLGAWPADQASRFMRSFPTCTVFKHTVKTMCIDLAMMASHAFGPCRTIQADGPAAPPAAAKKPAFAPPAAAKKMPMSIRSVISQEEDDEEEEEKPKGLFAGLFGGR